MTCDKNTRRNFKYFFLKDRGIENKASFRVFQDKAFTRPNKTRAILEDNVLKQIKISYIKQILHS